MWYGTIQPLKSLKYEKRPCSLLGDSFSIEVTNYDTLHICTKIQIHTNSDTHLTFKS